MSNRRSGESNSSEKKAIYGGYRPTGQRGYQPQSARPLDPMKLTPPKGGSAIQPPAQPKPSS